MPRAKRFCRTVLFLLIGAFVLFPTIAHGKDLLFPLGYRKSISSTFGEYRIGHPHAGLDFSTGLKTGHTVLAADDGAIIQIKVSCHGYGRALYHRTKDGRILVYAHLSGFAPKIDKAVREIQKQNGRYTFARFFTPDEFPVKRGEVIGYSGDTGTDVPHLHFEVRDSSNVTINPLKNGIVIEDTLPPAIERLHLEPLAYDAHVDGRWAEKTFTFKKNADESFSLSEPIRIGGRVGLSVQTTDFVNGTPRRLNPYHIELQINGERKFLIQYDRFDYREKSVSELDYIYRLKEKRHGAFHRLYRLFDKIVFYPEDLSGDLSNLHPGHYKARIIATDANGNRSEGSFTLNVNMPPQIQSVRLVEEGDKLAIRVLAKDPDGQVIRVSVSRKYGNDWSEIPAPARGKGQFEANLIKPGELATFRVLATDDSGLRSSTYLTSYKPNASSIPAGELKTSHRFSLQGNVFSLLLSRNAGFSHSPDIQITADPAPKSTGENLNFITYQEETAIRLNVQIPDDWPGGTVIFKSTFQDAKGMPYSGSWAFALQMVSPKGTVLGSIDGQAQMILPVGASYSAFPVTVEKKKVRAPSWLEPVSEAYSFSPIWEPLRKKPRVAIEVPADTPKLHEVGLYLYDRGVWWFMGNERQGSKIAARVAHLGTFALMRDTSPPDIGDITPSGVVDDLKPRITVKASDAGTDLFSGGIDFKLDGKRKIVEWHPLHGWIRFTPEKPLSVGTHKVVITLVDRAGNTSTRSGTFTISR